MIYRGFVLDGSGPDDLGLFGAARTSLIGHSFVATFEMDTSKGIPLFTATENYIHGGTLHGVDSPMLSATLEINGTRADVGTGLSDSVQSFLGHPGVANQQNHTASSAFNSILLDVISASTASAGTIPFTIDVPLTFSFDASVIGGGEAFFNVGEMSTSLSLGPTQLIYEYPPPKEAVPQRSNLAARLLGFVGRG